MLVKYQQMQILLRLLNVVCLWVMITDQLLRKQQQMDWLVFLITLSLTEREWAPLLLRSSWFLMLKLNCYWLKLLFVDGVD